MVANHTNPQWTSNGQAPLRMKQSVTADAVCPSQIRRLEILLEPLFSDIGGPIFSFMKLRTS